MSDDDQLRDSIAAAERHIQKLQQETHKHVRKKNRVFTARAVGLLIVAALLSLTSINGFYTASAQLRDDIISTELDFLMEADAEVLTYHSLFGELPIELPDYALRNFVQYQRTGANSYNLIPLLESDVVVARNLDEPLDVDAVRGSLLSN